MYIMDVNGLHKLFLEARDAAKYARVHYDELSSRSCSHVLYGPSADRLGASIPSSFTPVRARKLLRSTRRRNYITYELDSNYDVLRTIHVLDYKNTDCVYHHFELNGATYAYPFRGNGGTMYNDEISVLKFSARKPIYYASVASNMLFAQFYEYTDADTVIVSTYRYWTTAAHTQYGYPVDWNAPIGAKNSPVQCNCKEELCEYIDFSNWFK